MDPVGWNPAERRREAYPWSFEIAVGAGLGALLILAVGVHLGRGVACLLCGAGWVFPAVTDLFTSAPGVISGDPAAGLRAVPSPAPAGRLLAISVAGAELAMTVAAAPVLRLVWTRWGPGRLPGTASRAEAALLLGLGRLRRSAAVIRPDLYGRDK